MLSDIKKDAPARMQKSVDALRHELTKLRTGRATSALVDHLKVNYYGSEMPLSQVATVAVADARTLTITPWEKPMVAVVEKAIFASDLGLTPNTAGTVIRINLPPLDRRAPQVSCPRRARRGRGREDRDPQHPPRCQPPHQGTAEGKADHRGRGAAAAKPTSRS